MKRELTCIGCPMGCQLCAELDVNGGVVSVMGNECPRGATYARKECTAPERVVTSLMVARYARTPVSVRTAAPVPKEKIKSCLEEIRKMRPFLPVRAGDVLIADVAGTGVAVVASRDVC